MCTIICAGDFQAELLDSRGKTSSSHETDEKVEVLLEKRDNSAAAAINITVKKEPRQVKKGTLVVALEIDEASNGDNSNVAAATNMMQKGATKSTSVVVAEPKVNEKGCGEGISGDEKACGEGGVDGDEWVMVVAAPKVDKIGFGGVNDRLGSEQSHPGDKKACGGEGVSGNEKEGCEADIFSGGVGGGSGKASNGDSNDPVSTAIKMPKCATKSTAAVVAARKVDQIAFGEGISGDKKARGGEDVSGDEKACGEGGVDGNKSGSGGGGEASNGDGNGPAAEASKMPKNDTQENTAMVVVAPKVDEKGFVARGGEWEQNHSLVSSEQSLLSRPLAFLEWNSRAFGCILGLRSFASLAWGRIAKKRPRGCWPTSKCISGICVVLLWSLLVSEASALVTLEDETSRSILVEKAKILPTKLVGTDEILLAGKSSEISHRQSESFGDLKAAGHNFARLAGDFKASSFRQELPVNERDGGIQALLDERDELLLGRDLPTQGQKALLDERDMRVQALLNKRNVQTQNHNELLGERDVKIGINKPSAGGTAGPKITSNVQGLGLTSTPISLGGYRTEASGISKGIGREPKSPTVIRNLLDGGSFDEALAEAQKQPWPLSIPHAAATGGSAGPMGALVRTLATVSANSQASLNSGIATNVTIVLTADIALTTTVTSYAGIEIDGTLGLTIDGQGLYKVDGQNARRCIWITGSAEVELHGLIITKGNTVICMLI